MAADFVIPPHRLILDENQFLALLRSSRSLALEEKRRICRMIPDFDQPTLNELVQTLHDEKAQFAAIENDSPSEIQYVVDQRDREIMASELSLKLLLKQEKPQKES